MGADVNISGLITAHQALVNAVSNAIKQSNEVASAIEKAYTAADVLEKLKTVAGAGSGLNADMLDGLHASSFLRRIGGTMSGTLDMGGNDLKAITNIETTGDFKMFNGGQQMFHAGSNVLRVNELGEFGVLRLGGRVETADTYDNFIHTGNVDEIIKTISNSAGSSVRFNDGTLLAGGLGGSGESIAFAYRFKGKPIVVLAPEYSAGDARMGVVNTINESSFKGTSYFIDGNVSGVRYNWFAMGRWK